jgi:hypothetical protein
MLADTHEEIADYAARIAKLFKPGAKVTILVRNPARGGSGPHSADMIVTDDDLPSIKESIAYLQTRPEVAPGERQGTEV